VEKMTIKGTIYRGRVRTVEDAIDLWKQRHDDAMAVRDIEDIIDESCAALDMFVSWQNEAWECLKTGKITRVLDVGERFVQGYDVGEKLIGAVKNCIELAIEKEYAVDNSSKFTLCAKKFEKLHKEFLAKWPFPKTDDMDAGISAIASGDCIDLGGWISELQSANSEGNSTTN
jgi:hypothetical protein